MATIARFDPFRELVRYDPFRDNDFFRGFRMAPVYADMPDEPAIKLDVTEAGEAYTVKADMPGCRKEDIAVAVDGDEVSITAEVKREKEVKEGEKVLRSERYVGKQYRSFTLGHEIDQATAVAEFRDGVLTLTLPKKANGGSARLTVK